jgi:Tfp pilus assembly protein PilV
MKYKINWFGLAGGITILVVIGISLFVPWWQLTIGDNLMQTNASPVNTNFDLIGNSFTIPLLVALNIATLVSLTAGGIVMLIYSIKPTKSYSGRLLGFSYKKPLISIIIFVVGLFALTFIIKSLFNFDIPLMGTTSSTLPSNMTEGIIINVIMSAQFQYPFWLATIAAGLCIIAKFYHKNFSTISTSKTKVEASGLNSTMPISLISNKN